MTIESRPASRTASVTSSRAVPGTIATTARNVAQDEVDPALVEALVALVHARLAGAPAEADTADRSLRPAA